MAHLHAGQKLSPPGGSLSVNVLKKDLSSFVEKMEDGKTQQKDLLAFGGGDTDNGNWFELRSEAKCPERRGYAAQFIHGKKFYVFGGHDIREGTFSNLWMLDLSKVGDLEKPEDQQEKSFKWQKVETSAKDNPGPLSHHTCITWGDKMFNFGGTQYGEQARQLYTLDLKSYKWEKIQSRGDVPDSRDEHSAVVYEGCMWIYGGNVGGERVGDIYKFIFNENKWEIVKSFSKANPLPRAGHSAVVYKDSMIVFGGKDEDNNKLNDLWEFNMASLVWTQLKYENQPSERSGHTTCIYKDFLIIFGGIHEVTKELNDMHLYDIKNKRWINFFEELNSPDKLGLSPAHNYKKQDSSKGFVQRGNSQRGNSPGVRAQTSKGHQRINSSSMPSAAPISANQSAIDFSRNAITRGQSIKGRPQTSAGSSFAKTGSVTRRKRLSLFTKHQEKVHQHVELNSPTSIQMKSSFIIKNQDCNFEMYYAQIKK